MSGTSGKARSIKPTLAAITSVEADHLDIYGSLDAGVAYINNLNAAVEGSEYAEWPVQVRVVGDFARLSRFVEALGTLPRRLTLHDLQVTPLQGREQLRLHLQLRAYASGVPVAAPVPLAEAVQLPARDPFGTPAAAPAGKG